MHFACGAIVPITKIITVYGAYLVFPAVLPLKHSENQARLFLIVLKIVYLILVDENGIQHHNWAM